MHLRMGKEVRDVLPPTNIEAFRLSEERVKPQSKEGMISVQCTTQAVSGGSTRFAPAVVMRRPRRRSVVVTKARSGGVAAQGFWRRRAERRYNGSWFRDRPAV